MVNPLQYYKTATNQLDRVRSAYMSFMKTMNIPKTGNLSVMDIGVGSGRVFNEVLLPLLPENVTEIVLSDMDDDMLKFTQSITNDPRVHFENFNIEDEDIPKHLCKKFDLLFSSYCFSYLSDLRQGFKNSGRLLKPNGQLINMFHYQKNGLYATYQRMSKMNKWRVYTEEYAHYKPNLIGPKPEEELKNIFSDIGMTLCRFEFDPDFCLDMTKATIYDAYRSLDEKFSLIPKHLKDEYLKDFKTIFSEETEVDFLVDNLDVPIKFKFPTVIISAKN